MSPFWQGSIGLFHNDVIIGFAMVFITQLPWAPKRDVATLQYFYIEPAYQTNDNMVRLFGHIEEYCTDKGITSLKISNKNIDDNSLLNLGFNIEEKIYTKDYELEDGTKRTLILYLTWPAQCGRREHTHILSSTNKN